MSVLSNAVLKSAKNIHIGPLKLAQVFLYFCGRWELHIFHIYKICAHNFWHKNKLLVVGLHIISHIFLCFPLVNNHDIYFKL